MNFNRRERAFRNALVSRFMQPSELFEHIKGWHRRGPWFVSLYTNPERKLIVRRYFESDQEAHMRDWLANFDPIPVQWIAISADKAERCRHADARRVEL